MSKQKLIILYIKLNINNEQKSNANKQRIVYCKKGGEKVIGSERVITGPSVWSPLIVCEMLLSCK